MRDFGGFYKNRGGVEWSGSGVGRWLVLNHFRSLRKMVSLYKSGHKGVRWLASAGSAMAVSRRAQRAAGKLKKGAGRGEWWAGGQKNTPLLRKKYPAHMEKKGEVKKTIPWEVYLKWHGRPL